MAQHTTPMYRAPEMVDTWNNFPITIAADMWALGCVLYVLCYQVYFSLIHFIWIPNKQTKIYSFAYHIVEYIIDGLHFLLVFVI